MFFAAPYLLCTQSWLGSLESNTNLVIRFISEPRSEPNVGGQRIKLGSVISESHPV